MLKEGATATFERVMDALAGHMRVAHPILKILIISAPAVLAIIALRSVDYDLFARTAMGRLISTNGFLPSRDPFAFTPTKTFWYDHEWFAGLVFYYCTSWLGDIGLLALSVLFCVLTLFLFYQAQHTYATTDTCSKTNSPHFVLLILAALPSSFIWTSIIRAQVFTFLFWAIVLFCLRRYRGSSGMLSLVLLPPVFVIWASAHAGFVVGLGYLAIFCLVTLLDNNLRTIPIVACTLLAIAATLLNPYGIEYWGFVFEAVLKDRSLVTEWHPTSLLARHNLLLLPFTALMLSALWKRPKSVTLEGMIFALLSFWFALKHQRHVPFFYFSIAVYFSGFFADACQALKNRWLHYYQLLSRSVTFVIAGVSTLTIVALAWTLSKASQFNLDYSHMPVRAVEWLRQSKYSGKLLVHFNEGSYALWRLYPKFLISLDGRYEEVYPDQTVEQVLQAYNTYSPSHSQTIDEIAPDFVLLCKASTPEVQAQPLGSEWQVLSRANGCSVLGKADIDGSGEVIESGDSHATPDLRRMWEPMF